VKAGKSELGIRNTALQGSYTAVGDGPLHNVILLVPLLVVYNAAVEVGKNLQFSKSIIFFLLA
jgi:hypothetical protein